MGKQNSLKSFFKKAQWYVLLLTLCECLILFLTCFCIFASGMLLASRFVHVERYRFLSIWAAALLISLAVKIFFRKFRSFETPEAVAAFLEKKLKLEDNVLTTALYFETYEDTSSFSNVLLKQLFKDARAYCENIEVAACFDKTKLKKSSVAFCAALLVSFSLLSLSSASYKVSTSVVTHQQTRKGNKKFPPLEVFNIVWRIRYPSYTKLPEKTLEAAHLSVPYGSRIRFSGESSLPLSKVTAQNSEGVQISWSKKNFSGQFSATQTRTVSMKLEAEHQKKEMLAFSVQTQKDEPPKVTLTQPQEEEIVYNNKEIPLEIQASDDYGIKRLVLVVKKNKEKEKIFPLSFNKSSDVFLKYSFSPSAFLSQSGDEITCAVAAYDNDAFFGPKSARSRAFRVVFPKLAKQKETKELPQKNMESMSSSLYEKQSSLLEELAQTLKEIKTAQTVTPEQKETLLNIAQKQEDVLKEAETFQYAVKDLQKNPSAQDDLKELTSVLGEVDKLMSEILSQDTKKALEQLREALNKTQLTEMEKKLLEAKYAQEELLRKFRQTLNWLKMAKDEQFLSTMDKMLQELLARQNKLLEKTLDMPSVPEGGEKKFQWQELSFEQNALKKDAEDFQKMMEKEKEQSGQDKELKNRLSKFTESMNEKGVNEKMGAAGKALQDASFSKSVGMEQQSQKALDELSQQFQELQSAWLGSRKKKFARLLFELTSDVLLVSQKEEWLQKDLAKMQSVLPSELLSTYKTRLQEISSTQSQLSAKADKMSQKLSQLAELLPVMDTGLLSKVNGVQQLMRNAQKNAEDGLLPQAEILSQRTVEGLNGVAEELLKVQEKAKNFSASKMLEEYLKQLEDLAAMQNMLNDKTQQLSANGELSLFGLKQLAFEQGKLREMLSKLSGGLKPLSPSASSMLGGAGDDMDNVTERIKQKDVGLKVQKLQKKIHHKLLEAQLALKDQGKEEGRKAETAKTYKAKPVLKPLALKKEPFFKIKNEKTNWNESLIPEDYRAVVKQYLRAIGQ